MARLSTLLLMIVFAVSTPITLSIDFFNLQPSVIFGPILGFIIDALSGAGTGGTTVLLVVRFLKRHK